MGNTISSRVIDPGADLARACAESKNFFISFLGTRVVCTGGVAVICLAAVLDTLVAVGAIIVALPARALNKSVIPFSKERIGSIMNDGPVMVVALVRIFSLDTEFGGEDIPSSIEVPFIEKLDLSIQNSLDSNSFVVREGISRLVVVARLVVSLIGRTFALAAGTVLLPLSLVLAPFATVISFSPTLGKMQSQVNLLAAKYFNPFSFVGETLTHVLGVIDPKTIIG